MNILYHRYQTTLSELGGLAGSAIKKLYTYVVDLDLLVCGPQYWFYYGMGPQPAEPGAGTDSPEPVAADSPFTLEIAIPVEGQIPTALLAHFQQLPPAKCLSHRYQGSWEGLAGAYSEMRQYIVSNGLSMNGLYAESFLHIDRSVPNNNITEIHIGLF